MGKGRTKGEILGCYVDKEGRRECEEKWKTKGGKKGFKGR